MRKGSRDGARPTADLGLFAYFNRTGIDMHGRNEVPFLTDTGPTTLESVSRQGVNLRVRHAAEVLAGMGDTPAIGEEEK